MKLKKIFLTLLIFFISISSAYSFVVTDLVLTALEEAQYYAEKVRDEFKWISTLQDYKNKYEQIKKYYEQLKSLDISSFDDALDAIKIVNQMEKTVTNTISTLYSDITTNGDKMNELKKDLTKRYKTYQKTAQFQVDDLREKFGVKWQNYNEVTATKEEQEQHDAEWEELLNEIEMIDIQGKIMEMGFYESIKKDYELLLDDWDDAMKDFKTTYETLKASKEDLQKKYNEISLTENDSEIQIAQKKELRDTYRKEISELEAKIREYQNSIAKGKNTYHKAVKKNISEYDSQIEAIKEELEINYGIVIDDNEE